jgi:trigger factor
LKVNISKPESWKRIIDVEIPHEEVEKIYNIKLNDYKKQLNIPGFRQGKVPVTLIKSRFGKSVFAETIDDLIQEKFEGVCKENDINPVTKGVITNIKGDEVTAVSFSIEVEIDPDIQLDGYDKLKIRADKTSVKEEDVEKAIEDICERNAEFKETNQPSKKGDFLTIEYLKVVIDGEERKDFKNPPYPIEIGKGQLKDFDKGLTGIVAGDTKEILVKFPKDFTNKELVGKEGVFSIKVNKISEKILPELSDDFLKKIGDFSTVDALKDQLRKDLEQQAAERAKNEAYNKAIDSIIKDNPFDVPPSRIELYIDNLMEELKRYRRADDPEPKREEVAVKYRDAAIRAIKRFRIIDFVAVKEKIKATQEEVDKEIEKIAKMYNQNFDQVKQAFRQNGTTNRIRSDIREQKTLDFLIGEYVPAKE